MNLIWGTAGALVGLPAGSLLRSQVFRLSVPVGEPDQACCTNCAGPLPGIATIQCWHCGQWFGAPGLIELLTAAVVALLSGEFADRPEVAGYAFLGAVGVALALIDVAVQRLPDRLTLPAYPVLIGLLAGAAAFGRDGAALIRALLAGLTLTACFLMLGLISNGQLGGGDIKLAGLVGLVLGWLGWGSLIVGTGLGFGLAASVNVTLLARGKVSRSAMISFGPYLLAGALLAILLR